MERATYSVPEAAQRVGVSRSEGYEAVKRGEWPSRRIGSRIVIPKRLFDHLYAIEEQGPVEA